jgi:hypothetical protein
MDIAKAACAFVALLVPACNTVPTQIGVAGGAGGSNSGGSTSLGDGGAGGSANKADASGVVINLDVAPAWWGTADAPQAPEGPIVPTADSNCGTMTSQTKRQPVDVLLVLDRSSSMEWSIAADCSCSTATTGGRGVPGGPGATGATGGACASSASCTTRWGAVKPAVTTTLSSSSNVNWGLKFFPSPDNSATCNETTTMEVAVAPTSASQVAAQVNNATFSLGTPTTAALNAATAYLKTLDDGNKKFILLATDGEPNCGGSPVDINVTDVPGASNAAAAALAAGFQVYVVGIGPNLATLTQLAQAGGTTDYYPVSSPSDLVNALSSISKLVASCNFKSDQAPPDENNIAVYVNGQKVAQDANNGWTFGATTQEIILTGDACAQMSGGDQANVQILFGCEGQKYFPPNIY